MEYVKAELIDEHSLSIIAHSIRDSITEFFESEENQREFEEWKKKRMKESEEVQ